MILKTFETESHIPTIDLDSVSQTWKWGSKQLRMHISSCGLKQIEPLQ